MSWESHQLVCHEEKMKKKGGMMFYWIIIAFIIGSCAAIIQKDIKDYFKAQNPFETYVKTEDYAKEQVYNLGMFARGNVFYVRSEDKKSGKAYDVKNGKRNPDKDLDLKYLWEFEESMKSDCQKMVEKYERETGATPAVICAE